jgi:hypothetical protein
MSIPKIIWTYWDDRDNIPPIVADCLSQYVKGLVPHGWEIRLLHKSSQMVQNYLKGHHKAAELSKPAFSDWLRLHLLRDYGGCWLDASIYVDDPKALGVLIDLAKFSNGVEVVGYHNGLMQTNDKYPVIESALLMAVPKSQFIQVWLEEFMKATAMGFRAYNKELPSRGVDTQKILSHQGLGVYLTVQTTAQAAMMRCGTAAVRTVEAHFGMYALRRLTDADPDAMKAALDNLELRRVAGITKLTSFERSLYV